MSVEARRGCGFRKVGGLYLVSGELAAPCCKLPHLLEICPCCGGGIKQTRGWTWVSPTLLLGLGGCTIGSAAFCPAGNPTLMGDRAGLLWIGRGFYKTSEEFRAEAAAQGISRRLTAVPRGMVIGQTWVLLAHPEACDPLPLPAEDSGEAVTDERYLKRRPGIFSMFLPTAIELIVKQSEYDAALADGASYEASTAEPRMKSELLERFERDRARGVTWVPVPDNDPDHQGTVYDKDEKDDLLTEQGAS